MTEDHIPEGPISDEEPDTNGLTSIQGCIHCPAPAEGVLTETDQIIVNNFLETLAEIAISIASRERKNTEDVKDVKD